MKSKIGAGFCVFSTLFGVLVLSQGVDAGKTKCPEDKGSTSTVAKKEHVDTVKEEEESPFTEQKDKEKKKEEGEDTVSRFLKVSPHKLEGVAEEADGITELEVLSTEGDVLDDETAVHLNRFKNVESLDLCESKITNLGFLEGLTHLTSLSIDYTKITDIGILEEFPNLKKLSLRDLAIQEFALLRKLKNIEVLNLGRTNFEDLNILKEHAQLQELNLRRSGVRDPSVLSNFTELRSLNLGCLLVTKDDFSILSMLSKLEILNVDDTAFDNLRILSNHSNLRILSLQSTGIMDIEGLAQLTLLEKVDLRGNSIEDLSPLMHLGKLQKLRWGNPNEDKDFLEVLRQLRKWNPGQYSLVDGYASLQQFKVQADKWSDEVLKNSIIKIVEIKIKTLEESVLRRCSIGVDCTRGLSSYQQDLKPGEEGIGLRFIR